jgi:hypothetical protein
VGVNRFSSSKLSWDLHEAWILASVSGVGPQTFCRWNHLQKVGQGWLRIRSSNGMFVFEAVILGGSLTIKGSGFGSLVASSVGPVLRSRSSMCSSWVPHSLSSSRALVSATEGTRF